MKVYSATPATHSNTKLVVCCILSALAAASLTALIVWKTNPAPSSIHTDVQTPLPTLDSKIEPPRTPTSTVPVKTPEPPPAITPPEPVSLQVVPPDFEMKLGQRLKLRGATIISGLLVRYELKSAAGIVENWFVEPGKSFSLNCTLPSAPTPELLEAARHIWKESIDGVLTTKDIQAGQACLDEVFGKAAPTQEVHSAWRYGGTFEIQATLAAPDVPGRPAALQSWSFTIATRSPPRL